MRSHFGSYRRRTKIFFENFEQKKKNLKKILKKKFLKKKKFQSAKKGVKC